MDISLYDVTEDHITVATQTMHYSSEIPQIYHILALFHPTQKAAPFNDPCIMLGC